MIRLQVYTTKHWRLCRTYGTDTSVRDLVWHPIHSGAVIVGSANGDINKLRLDLKIVSCHRYLKGHSCFNDLLHQGSDFTALHKLHGLIYAMAINSDGTQLAVGVGPKVVLIRHNSFGKSFRPPILQGLIFFVEDWGPPTTIPFQHSGTSMVRGIHYLGKSTVVVSFLESGIMYEMSS